MTVRGRRLNSPTLSGHSLRTRRAAARRSATATNGECSTSFQVATATRASRFSARRISACARAPSRKELQALSSVRCFATAVWHLVRGSGGPLYVEVKVALGVSIEVKMPLSMHPARPRPASWVR
jgi:hypothetical protein